MKRLIILHSDLPLKNISAPVMDAGITTWLPLISDYGRVRELQESLKGIAGMCDISSELQDVATRLRRPFYEVTARLGIKYNSLEWWANDISERNTMKSSLFLHCCYSYIASRKIEEQDSLAIIADSGAVIKNITSLAEKRGIEVKAGSCFTMRDRTSWVFLEGLFKLVLHIAVFALARLNRLYHRCITKRLKPLQSIDVILHTWVDEKCFGANDEFKDRYFTILPDYYHSKNIRKATFVTFSYRNITRSFWNVFSFLHTNREDFIIPQDYYHPGDYRFPFQIWFKQRRFVFSNIELDGVDCSVLFREYHRKEPIHYAAMDYLLFKRLSEKGIKPKVVVDGFENMTTDKMIQLGVREFMPGTAVYGFFHTVPPPNVLCFFTDIHERDIAPMPDRIICNGPRYKDIFAKEHFPDARIVVGAALRYLYLYNVKRASATRDGDFKILLVLPVEKDAVVELFYKVKSAIEGKNHYRIILKPHPMETAILKSIKGDFPSGAEVFFGGMEEALSKCDIVVSAATGAVLDCVMADKEVIRVGRSTQIDFDPLAWFEEFGRPVSSIDELREKLQELEHRIMSGSYEPPCYSKMLPELFCPMTEETMKPFLPPESVT